MIDCNYYYEKIGTDLVIFKLKCPILISLTLSIKIKLKLLEQYQALKNQC